jgi:hypothetical protein
MKPVFTLKQKPAWSKLKTCLSFSVNRVRSRSIMHEFYFSVSLREPRTLLKQNFKRMLYCEQNKKRSNFHSLIFPSFAYRMNGVTSSAAQLLSHSHPVKKGRMGAPQLYSRRSCQCSQQLGQHMRRFRTKYYMQHFRYNPLIFTSKFYLLVA